MVEKWDVVVVGAGFGGSAAAKRAAEKGLKTLLLEKSRKPGDKNVSGTNILAVGALLPPVVSYIFEGPIEREIDCFRFYWSPGNFTSIYEWRYIEPFSFSIRRDIFDPWHAKMAVSAGATLRTSTTVVDVVKEDNRITGVVTEKGEKILANVVIDAGGAHSIVGRKAGLIKKRSGVDNVLYATVYVELSKKIVDERWGSTNEYYLFPGIAHKVWPWIFPKKKGVTIGTGGYMTGELGNVNNLLQKFLSLPLVDKKLRGGKIKAWGLHCDPDKLVEKTYTHGLMLIGDAGGFVWPFIGEGHVEALRTGIYAADVAAEAVSKGDSSEEVLKKYEELWKADTYLNFVYNIGRMQKDTCLKWPESDFIRMMSLVMAAGGFITAHLHARWIEAAKERNIEKLLEALNGYNVVEGFVNLADSLLPTLRKIRKKVKRRG